MSLNKSTVSIECRNCGCKHCPVETTVHREIIYRGKKIYHIKRYRVCRYCKLPFTTIETYESEENPDFPAVHPNADDGELVGFPVFINPNKNQNRTKAPEMPPDLLPPVAAEEHARPATNPLKRQHGVSSIPPKKRPGPAKRSKKK